MRSHFIKRNNYSHAQSFSVKHDRMPCFFRSWQHHDELELILFVKSHGIRFIGDSIEPFVPGELILMGENLPHKWLNSQEYFETEDLVAESIVIHFEKEFLRNALEQTIELNGIKKIIENAKGGLLFKGVSKELAPKKMWNLLNTPPGLERMIGFLDLLNLLVKEKNYEFITGTSYSNLSNDDKLRKVNGFVMNNFQIPITLEQVANEVNMNKSAFCRYFKKTTLKNFSNYLNEVRISYACKLLQMPNRRKIVEVCFESGFNNLSNFNRKFKRQTGYSPSEYAQLSS